MRITVKTAGLLGKYLPAGSRANLAELDIAEGATPIDVMRTLGMPEDRTYLVVLNGENLPKARRPNTQLSEDDELAIMPPLKGG
jgi:sulfur carrier protein ThiS